jgi:hypothetical protein
MAIVQLPIPYRARNLAGGMIFQYYYGKTHIRAYPESYQDANTKQQQINRNYFTHLISIFKKLKGFYSSFFYYKPKTMTTYNSVISCLLKGYDLIDNQKILAPDKIKFGNGKITDYFLINPVITQSENWRFSFNFGLLPSLPLSFTSCGIRFILICFTNSTPHTINKIMPMYGTTYDFILADIGTISGDILLFAQAYDFEKNIPLSAFVTAPTMFHTLIS